MTVSDDPALDQQALLDLVNGSIEATVPVAAGMGVRFTVVRRGYAESTAPFEGNGNHFGVMYAGVLFTVAEVLGGAIALASFDASRFFPLVKNLEISFRRPAGTDVVARTELTEDEIARVAAEAEARGKADFVLEATVTDAAGEVVATTRGTYQIRAIA